MGTEKLNAYQLISELKCTSEAMLKPGDEWKFIDHSNDKERTSVKHRRNIHSMGQGLLERTEVCIMLYALCFMSRSPLMMVGRASGRD